MQKAYLRLLEKFAQDTEFEKQFKARQIYLQRIRFCNPTVREKHRLACIAWREKKARQGANINTPSDFNCSFD